MADSLSAPAVLEPSRFHEWKSDFFTYSANGALSCEGVSAESLAAQHGTPLYIYSAAALRKSYREIATGFAALNPLVCYSVKACSTLAILDLLNREGCGFDCVSQGEILRCLKVGVDPQRIVFAGVGKTASEIEFALRANILMFNVESLNELEAIAAVASRINIKAGIAFRLNPDVDPRTHAYISTGQKESKFGIDLARAEQGLAFCKQHPELILRGVHFHIGSQITSDSRHVEAVHRATAFVRQIQAQGFPLEYFNVGGGFGISYRGTEGLPFSDFAKVIVPAVKDLGLRIATEPGRYIAGNSAILLTRVIYTKEGAAKPYIIVDAAMNDLLRPSIYQAYHGIWPTAYAPRPLKDNEARYVDVVGPICESGDFLAKDRQLPAVKQGELLAVFSAGAYGFAMASNYNTRPRAAEVLVDGTKSRIIRARETYDDLLRGETV
jgi:diaminopimelate decarboxylase